MSHNPNTLSNLIKIVGLALVAAAIYQELRKPPEERAWHGKLADLIPYDFRPPKIERFRERLWNPDDPRIFTEHVFGVGWAVNFYTLLERLQMLSREPETSTPEDTD
ncbi:MAG TPA: hypothetical protein G4O13_05825 [Dehalococcoidia bacterium]|nr:hypothetical protein [Dehalococcoidia bacterium]